MLWAFLNQLDVFGFCSGNTGILYPRRAINVVGRFRDSVGSTRENIYTVNDVGIHSDTVGSKQTLPV
jgi:hypothetical protein